MIQFQKCYDFLKAYKETFQMVCFNPKFRWGPNLSFFGLGPWAIIIHGMAKLTNSFFARIWTLITPFERSPFKISENQKIIEIGSTEVKLWQLNESPNHCWWCS